MIGPALALLRRARAKGSCLAAFNAYNLETAQAVFDAAKQAGSPAILAFGAAYERHMPLETAAAMVHSLEKARGVPMTLHLDHCDRLDTLKRAVDAGFDSVMIDGSALPLEQNIALTRQAAQYAHAAGVALEAELGGLNPEDGSPAAAPMPFTDPAQAARLVAETGADTLAVSVGNAHGLYRREPHLQMDRLAAIYEAAGVPLVLHGSTGIPFEQLRQAARIAVAKINVNTEIALAGAAELKRLLLSAGDTPVKLNALLPDLQRAMAAAMIPFIRIGSTLQ